MMRSVNDWGDAALQGGEVGRGAGGAQDGAGQAKGRVLVVSDIMCVCRCCMWPHSPVEHKQTMSPLPCCGKQRRV